MKVVFLLYEDRMSTRVMQALDLFEKFKVVMQPLVRASVVDDWGQPHLAKIRGLDNEYNRLIAAFGSDGTCHYRDEAVRVVSDGRNWQTLDDYIRSLSG